MFPEELETAARLKWGSEQVSWTKLPRRLEQEFNRPFTYDEVRNALRRHPDYSGASKGNIIYDDKKPLPTDSDMDEVMATFISLQKSLKKLDNKQVEADLELKDTKPVGIGFTGDWHLGGKGVDHEAFCRNHELFLGIDGLYLGGAGDYKDQLTGAIHRGSEFEQILPPGTQDVLALHWIEKLKYKLLWLVAGCHDTWAKKLSDRHFIDEASVKADCLNLWHGGLVALTLGTQTYKIRVRHKYKFNSALNMTNSQKRQVDMEGGADVVAHAHFHVPHLEHVRKAGRDFVALRSGSYKIWDEYGQQLAGYKGEIGIPIVVFYPDKHEIVPFKDFNRGIEYLLAVRSNLSEV